MALKDLVGSLESVQEGDIEEIIKDYIRFDTEQPSLILTKEASKLSNRAKTLALLVANAGWIYIDTNIPPLVLKPKLIEELTGIPGGTLRPLLISLKKDRLLKADKGSYSIVDPNLSNIRDVIFSKM